jgi:glycine/D-amino acid oxidase-like deaminating enzyme/nitrite reductase/ring-hydroxylating ferredoxin subunit
MLIASPGFMSTTSVWQAGLPASSRPQLTGTKQADVCVVGAGIAGLTTAYLLAKAGQTVVVLERADIGGGETSLTSAHLSNLPDFKYSDLVKMHGIDVLRKVAESHTAAIRSIENIVETENIVCGFQRVPGYLMPSQKDEEDTLEREFRDASGAGLPVMKVDTVPLVRVPDRPALRFPNQAQFHPMRYLTALAKICEMRGVRIYGSTQAESIDPGNPATVKTSNGAMVRAMVVVQASNAPFAHTLTMHTKQTAYRTYVAAFPFRSAEMEKALIWDTADPFHFVRTFRTQDGRDLLLVGGEDHKTGHDPEEGSPLTHLTAWARNHFDIQGDADFFWSGQILEPVDGLAYIGRVPGEDHQNLYLVTGTSGNGLTYGTIAGLLLSDLVQGKPNPWQNTYDPGRVNLKATTEFVSHNLNAVAQYAEWITPGEVSNDHEIAPGSGAILRDGLSKLAVYKDPGGAVHRLSATCPHMGCLVSWNPEEKTWDCPCHGSRFAPEGAVLNGPAVQPLAKAEQRTS